MWDNTPLTVAEQALVSEYWPFAMSLWRKKSAHYRSVEYRDAMYDVVMNDLIACARSWTRNASKRDPDMNFKAYLNQRVAYAETDMLRALRGRKGQLMPAHSRTLSDLDATQEYVAHVSGASFYEEHDRDADDYDPDLAEEVLATLNIRDGALARAVLRRTTMATIGEAYGISESRVCQIYAKFIERYVAAYRKKHCVRYQPTSA